MARGGRRPSTRRSPLITGAATGLAACAIWMIFAPLYPVDSGFVALPPPTLRAQGLLSRLGGDVSMADKEAQARYKSRKCQKQAQRFYYRDVGGRALSRRYIDASGIDVGKDEDTFMTWSSTLPIGKQKTVSFKSRPFGVLTYQPGEDWKGAMVSVLGKPMYTGDPNGQAMENGVKEGMVVKAINGKNVLTENYNDIMLQLRDNFHRYHTPKFPLPLDVTFAELPGWKEDVDLKRKAAEAAAAKRAKEKAKAKKEEDEEKEEDKQEKEEG